MAKKLQRNASVSRVTNETSVEIELDLAGGKNSIATGVGFFDHMLTLFACHGGFGLSVSAEGDTHVDGHHTVEDVGIALGEAFYIAAGGKKGIVRYGQALLPMDETLAEVAVDFGGRAYLHFDVDFPSPKTGDFDLALVEEFFRAFAMNAKITLHINLRYGKNAHHMAEAVFKGAARALAGALTVTGDAMPSTKGMLA